MNRSSPRVAAALAGLMLLLPALAHAHAGGEHTHGLLAGISHPLSGADHLLAMLAVGAWSAQQGGRSLWVLPAAFVGMLVVGGALGMSGMPLPQVEQGIQLSLLVLGLLLVFALRVSPFLGAVLVGAFALFHGHAHGTEMGATVAALPYATGFALSTALLHGVGIGGVLLLHRTARAQLLARAGGALVAVGGLWFAVA